MDVQPIEESHGFCNTRLHRTGVVKLYHDAFVLFWYAGQHVDRLGFGECNEQPLDDVRTR
jgi:hypothetical protein